MADLAVLVVDALQGVVAHEGDTDSTVDHARSNIGRGQPSRLFVQRVELLVAGLGDLAKVHAPVPEIHELDVRHLEDAVPDGTAAGVVDVTPPYVPARTTTPSTSACGSIFSRCVIATSKRGELGLRGAQLRRRSRSRRARVAQGADGLHRQDRAQPRPRPRGRDRTGDSVAAGRAMFALDDLRDALTGDLSIEAWASQERTILGQLERRAFGARAKSEHIVVLRRT